LLPDHRVDIKGVLMAIAAIFDLGTPTDDVALREEGPPPPEPSVEMLTLHNVLT
jgi:hypothetical protein